MTIGSSDEIFDVAIVGGGVAGTYCAWRLVCDHPPRSGQLPKVALLEGSGRIGGRLLSVKPPGMERMVCELGGTYFSNVHPLVSALVTHLRLALDPVHSNRHLYYVRGTRVPARFTEPPYELAPEERNLHPDQLLRRACERLVPGGSHLRGEALDQAVRSSTLEGRNLADWGTSSALSKHLSHEALQLIRDTRPDDFMLGNGNAADALRSLLTFGKGTTFSKLTEGFDRLPKSLCDRAEDAGATILLRHRLEGFERCSEGLIRLRLARDSRGWGPSAEGEPLTVRARALILAIPQRSLELLDQRSPFFRDKEVARLLASVTPLSLLRAFTCYAAPWWEELGFKIGLAATDLPLNSSHYLGSESDLAGADRSNRNSLLMATLAHSLGAGFWASLRERATPSDSYTGSSAWEGYALPVEGRFTQEMQRQLSEVHGFNLPSPYAASFMDWGVDPFGCAGSSWKVGVRSEELAPRIVAPSPGLPIFICGDAYSRNQGWVEGSLETSELVLQKHLGLTRPDWVASAQEAS